MAALIVAAFWHYQHLSGEFQPAGPPFAASPLYGVPPFHWFYAYGYLGVDLFFMISGVVFGHVYAVPIAARRIGAGRFAWLRFARCYPLHLLTLLLAGALAWLFYASAGRFPVYQANGIGYFALNLLLLQAVPFVATGGSFNGPAWSLSIEALMYGVFFLVASTGRARAIAPLLVVVGAVGWLHGLDGNFARGLVGFFGGLVIQQQATGPPLRRTLVALLFAQFAVLAVCGVLPHSADIDLRLAVAWAAFALLLSIVQGSGLLQRALAAPALRALGDLSLGIYLLNIPVQFAVLIVFAWLGVAPPTQTAALWLGVTLLVVGAAWAAHVGFERPCRNWLRGLRSRPAAPAVLALRPQTPALTPCRRATPAPSWRESRCRRC